MKEIQRMKSFDARFFLLLQCLIEFLSIVTYSIMHDMILDSSEKCCRIGKIKPVCSIYIFFLSLSLSLTRFFLLLANILHGMIFM